jgi:hypothetical protein
MTFNVPWENDTAACAVPAFKRPGSTVPAVRAATPRPAWWSKSPRLIVSNWLELFVISVRAM